jgi:hypothetical protein
MYPGKDGGMGAPSIACWIIMSICIFLAACEYYRRLNAGRERRKKCIDALNKCNGQDRKHFMKLFQDAFEAFDELGAGSLHIDVLRKILIAAFNKDFNQDGKIDSKEIYLNSIDEARALAGATGGQLSFEGASIACGGPALHANAHHSAFDSHSKHAKTCFQSCTSQAVMT